MDFRFLQEQKAEKERILTELNKKHNFDKMRDLLQQRFADLLSGRGIPPRVPDPEFAEGDEESGIAFENGKTQFQARNFRAAKASFQRSLAGAKATNDSSIISLWIRSCRGEPLISLRAFDDKLRDLLLIARLDELISSRAQVSDKEAYDEFKKLQHTRKFDWVKLTAPEELSKKVKESITEEELETLAKAQALVSKNTVFGTLGATWRFPRCKTPLPVPRRLGWLEKPCAGASASRRRSPTTPSPRTSSTWRSASVIIQCLDKS